MGVGGVSGMKCNKQFKAHPNSISHLLTHSPHNHRHQHHRVVAEDVDHFHRHSVAARFGVGVGRGVVASWQMTKRPLHQTTLSQTLGW
jgi:hypothetical protein